MGRPPMLTAHQRTEALRALADGSATQADLARRFNVSQSTISRLGNKLIPRSEEHTSELQSLMRISYDVFCLKKNKLTNSDIHKYTIHKLINMNKPDKN